MPTMANITVKKYDGTTDITYTTLTRSAGDKSPAAWRSESVGSIPINRPSLSLETRSTADKKARIVSGVFTYPETFTDSTTGQVRISYTIRATFQVVIPSGITDGTAQEASAQFGNLLDSPLIQECIRTCLPPQ